jgi:hypothetical protein
MSQDDQARARQSAREICTLRRDRVCEPHMWQTEENHEFVPLNPPGKSAVGLVSFPDRITSKSATVFTFHPAFFLLSSLPAYRAANPLR